jgi:hypothetical protein
VRDREIGRNRKRTERPNHSLSSYFLLFPSCSFFSFLFFLLIYSFSLPLHRTQTEVERENRGDTERETWRESNGGRSLRERERTRVRPDEPRPTSVDQHRWLTGSPIFGGSMAGWLTASSTRAGAVKPVTRKCRTRSTHLKPEEDPINGGQRRRFLVSWESISGSLEV